MPRNDLIETPYGRKTPELLCKAMDVYTMFQNNVMYGAAPELLAACFVARQALSDIISASENGDPYSTSELLEHFMPDYDKIVEAIAKAKGESL